MARILVVDDDEDILASMRDVLMFAIDGAVVETARSGPAALRRMAGSGPDALVTDYRMPGMDGLELAAAAHRERPRMPIIMVTAYRDRQVEEEAGQSGVVEVVHKPFDAEALVEAVRSRLGE